VATIARQKQLVLDTGRALIREANALSAGQRLTARSRSLLELGERDDWQGLREELECHQEDVEESMLALRDGESAGPHQPGGWLRGFQLAAHVTSEHYTGAKAAALVRPAVVDLLHRQDGLPQSFHEKTASRRHDLRQSQGDPLALHGFAASLAVRGVADARSRRRGDGGVPRETDCDPAVPRPMTSEARLRALGERYIRRTCHDFPQWGSGVGFRRYEPGLSGSDEATRLGRNRFLEGLLAEVEALPASLLSGDDWLDRRCFLSLLRTELFQSGDLERWRNNPQECCDGAVGAVFELVTRHFGNLPQGPSLDRVPA